MRIQDQLHRRIAETKKWKKKSIELRGLNLVSLPSMLLADPIHYRITSIDLSHNKLTNLQGISTARNLVEICARNNLIVELETAKLEILRDLMYLDLAHNEIYEIPESLASLHELTTLNLSGNSVKYLPERLVHACKLERLHVTKNPIKNVPRDVFVQGLQMLRRHFSSLGNNHSAEWKKCQMCTVERFMRSLSLREDAAAEQKDVSKPSATSDYGTCTCSADGLRQGSSRGWTDDSSCHGDYDSDSELSIESEISGPYGYEDSNGTLRVANTDSDEDYGYFDRYGKTLPDHSRLLKYKRVTAVIPGNNMQAYTPDEFTLNIVEDLYYTPELTERTTMQASQVVSMGPHGAEFFEDEPALIFLPLGAHVDDPEQIVCLCSDTSEHEIPDWRPLPKSHYVYMAKDNKVLIKAWHFSLFTAIVSCPYPEVSQTVKANEEATVTVEDVKGVEVHFPKHSLPDDFEAKIKVFYSDDPVEVSDQNDEGDTNALATPIVLLGPHGVDFAKDVSIQLPIPDCYEIMQEFKVDPKSSLTIWQSSTDEDEPMSWQPCSVDFTIHQNEEGFYLLTFPVRHFSWYKAVWEILSSTMHSAKRGVSHFYPYVRFSMMCQAMMDETADTRSFGLEVICYRSDKKLPEMGNYKHKIGGSTKPKFVRPGAIAVRLVSNDFEADVLHGEDASLVKEEPDFHGLEFEKQFACVYKGEPVQKGVIGKCIVERKTSGASENIFEFNLTKYGHEGEFTMDSTDGWSLMATRELASVLSITSDDNWKTFARHLGFTNHEIKNKLNCTTDPFALIMGTYQSRGGTPDEFVQALYTVGRQFRIGDSSTDGIGFTNRSSANHSGFRSTTDEEDDSDCSRPGPSRSSTPSRKKRMYSGAAAVPVKKRSRSIHSDSVSTYSKSSIHDDHAHRMCKEPYGTNEMWKVSQFINTQWKSLGRTLSVPEEDLNSVEHANKDSRECSFQMLLKYKERFPHKCTYGALYTALCECGLNSVATSHCCMPRSPH